MEFAVKQRRPKSLVEAVSCTIEAECYLPKPTRVSCVEIVDSVPTPPSQELSVAAVQRQQGAMMGILEGITKRLENLEERLSTSRVLQGTLSSRVEGVTSKESTRPSVSVSKKDIMQGGVLQTAAGAGKLDTLGAMRQAHEGVLQVPQKIILTVNPVTAVQVQG